ncbi:hypothetical protein PF008_g1319 [Phytophthora fragariae]|uniref:Uncharacterized protein n=1 Tax=Phytophthora fragariae TaxID=53985 RepID=A0A6G0SMA1_9STRA|nr:hypothetical protein PF008_g1319 [Phytophthora fragariae]
MKPNLLSRWRRSIFRLSNQNQGSMMMGKVLGSATKYCMFSNTNQWEFNSLDDTQGLNSTCLVLNYVDQCMSQGATRVDHGWAYLRLDIVITGHVGVTVETLSMSVDALLLPMDGVLMSSTDFRARV